MLFGPAISETGTICYHLILITVLAVSPHAAFLLSYDLASVSSAFSWFFCYLHISYHIVSLFFHIPLFIISAFFVV